MGKEEERRVIEWRRKGEGGKSKNVMRRDGQKRKKKGERGKRGIMERGCVKGERC